MIPVSAGHRTLAVSFSTETLQAVSRKTLPAPCITYHCQDSYKELIIRNPVHVDPTILESGNDGGDNATQRRDLASETPAVEAAAVFKGSGACIGAGFQDLRFLL